MVRIVGISDIHYTASRDTRQAIDDIINYISNIDIVACHGDLIHVDSGDVEGDLTTIKNKIETISASEFYYTPGNHDHWFKHRRVFGKTYDIVEKNTYILAVIDSSFTGRLPVIPYLQIYKLVKLAKQTGKAIIMFTHAIPCPMCGHDDYTTPYDVNYEYWVARNGECLLNELDSIGVKVLILTGHIWPSTAQITTWGNNITLACKRHTWDGTGTSCNGDTYVIDIDETNRTITINVFKHNTKTISQIGQITY